MEVSDDGEIPDANPHDYLDDGMRYGEAVRRETH